MTSDCDMRSIAGVELNPEQDYTEKVRAVEKALTDLQEPYCSGISVVPDHQLFLYYTTHDNSHRRINFAEIKPNDLDLLYQACKPAEFGRNAESVLDETYRKAGKMDLSSFSTLFDPRSLGIHKQVVDGLLFGKQGVGDGVILELYKLNVYGEGDFFKLHKDTPRSERMLGSLVVVLPTKHEGGQLVLYQGDKQWTIDFSNEFATAAKPSACFVAFFGDVDHEVLPVTSGHRVTLTYNIYHDGVPKLGLSRIPSPFHHGLKRALAELVNDKAILPRGGYLGFGLIHEYVFDNKGLVESILHSLKGADQVLAELCDELSLHYSIKLLYDDIVGCNVHVITDRKLVLACDDTDSTMDVDQSDLHLLVCALHRSPEPGFIWTIKEAEGVRFVGCEHEKFDDKEYEEILREFYRDPVTEILEVRKMSAMGMQTPFASTYGNGPYLSWFYGKACLLVTVDPVEARQLLLA